MGEITEAIYEAVRHRRQIVLRYGDDPPGKLRVCRPHIVYVNAFGTQCVDVYQVGGHSSGELPSWRRFLVESIESVEPQDTTFRVAPGYNPSNESWYPKILCSISQVEVVETHDSDE